MTPQLATAAETDRTASTTVYQAVNRTRIESKVMRSGWGASRGPGPSPRLENVARPADGVNELGLTIAIDNPSQAADVDFDEVRERIECVVPDVLRDLLASDDPAGVQRQELEQSVLLRRQQQFDAAAQDPMRARIDAQVADLEDGVLPRTAPAQYGSQPRQKLSKLERLDQVVVGSGVESLPAVGQRVARGEHEDAHIDPVC